MLKSLYAALVVAATFAVPALCPQQADAQVWVGGPRVGVTVGRPYYGGYYGNGYYNNGYYGNTYYRSGYYAPSYYYGGYTPGYYNSYYATPRAYRYWR